MTLPPRLLGLVVLFALYTAGSVSGLLLLRSALPELRAQVAAGRVAAGALLVVIAGAALYAIGFVMWLVILSRLPLAPAYAIAIGLTLAATSVTGILVLGEDLSWRQVLGIVTVGIGILLISVDLPDAGARAALSAAQELPSQG